MFVEIDDYFVQGLLHISDLGADYFRFERSQQCLIGDRNGQRFTLGDPIQVLVAGVEPAQGKNRFAASAPGQWQGKRQQDQKQPSGGGKRTGRGRRR